MRPLSVVIAVQRMSPVKRKPPSIQKRIPHQNRILTLRTRAHQRHGTPNQLLDPLHIFDRLRWQIGPASGACGGFAPAFDFLIDWHGAGLVGGVGGEVVVVFFADGVAGADFERCESVKHVKLRERDAGDAADRDRLAHKDSVEPAAAPFASGDGAEFMAALAQTLPGFVLKLGWEWPGTNAGGVGLDDAKHEANRGGAEA